MTSTTAPAFIDDPDTEFAEYFTLTADPYPHRIGAELPDDGIVDEVAVERFVEGDRTVRLSPREVLCVVALAAHRGKSDAQIAALFGRDNEGERGSKWVLRIRQGHRIPAAPQTFTDAYLWNLIREPSRRDKAGAAALAAAGFIVHDDTPAVR